ncbi:MAG: hypothetical protein IPK60_01180 [Sandaracinaceae bacterium]|nr:hypothetical protein [Sandaracinaceae bacterium]
MSVEATTSWIDKAEKALRAGVDIDDVEVLRGASPPVLDGAGMSAVLAPVVAAGAWAFSFYRDHLNGSSIDPLGLFVRIVALVLTIRAAFLLAMLIKRLNVMSERKDYRIAICDEGILYRSPVGDIALPRTDIIDIVERGDWRGRAGRRYSEVFIVTRPSSGRVYVEVPPVFDATAGAFAERLMRWRGPLTAKAAGGSGEVVEISRSRLFDDVAGGARPEGVAVLKHGRGWLRKGPYATVLVGAAVFIGYARLPADALRALGPALPLMIGSCLLAVPFLWAYLIRREIRPRKGIALVITASDMLMRARSGVLRVALGDIVRATVEVRSSWSLLEGYHGTKRLLISRRNAPDIRYDEAYLGVPCEVAQSLIDGYRKRLLP